MVRHCLFCSHELGTNEVVEHFQIGARVAFDTDRGRLWAICSHCERWNLAPFDERWEALEECERLFSQLPVQVSTDEIGLARHRAGLDLVRIGRPANGEFAAWRYGDGFLERGERAATQTEWQVAQLVGAMGLGSVAAGAAAVAALPGAFVPLIAIAPWAIIPWFLWRNRQQTRVQFRTRTGPELTLHARDFRRARWQMDESGNFSIVICPGRRETQLMGKDAEHAAALILPKADLADELRDQSNGVRNPQGRQKILSEATTCIEGLRDTIEKREFLAKTIREQTFPLSMMYRERQKKRAKGVHVTAINRMSPPTRLALEMVLHEEQERRALAGELDALSLAWVHAEEIAAIEDSLSVPASVEGRLEVMRTSTE